MDITIEITSEEIEKTQNTILDIYCELLRIRKLLEEDIKQQERSKNESN